MILSEPSCSEGWLAIGKIGGVAELRYDFTIAMPTGRANNRSPLRHFTSAIGKIGMHLLAVADLIHETGH
jgi:hypothetical protein